VSAPIHSVWGLRLRPLAHAVSSCRLPRGALSVVRALPALFELSLQLSDLLQLSFNCDLASCVFRFASLKLAHLYPESLALSARGLKYRLKLLCSSSPFADQVFRLASSPLGGVNLEAESGSASLEFVEVLCLLIETSSLEAVVALLPVLDCASMDLLNLRKLSLAHELTLL